MFVVAAGLAWEWKSKDPEVAKPEIIGPFDTQDAAIAFLRGTFPTFNDQTTPGADPDSAYTPFVVEVFSPGDGFSIPIDDLVAPEGGLNAFGDALFTELKDKADGKED